MEESKFGTHSLADQLISGLKTAEREIEELALQFALGKAEATDKFEEIKDEFNDQVSRWKRSYPDLKAKLDDLRLQLALGKADATDLFEEQRKKIISAVNNLENEITKNPGMKEHLNEFKNETEKFKLKLEILKLKFEQKKFTVKEEFVDAMDEVRLEADKLFKKVEDKWSKRKSAYADFSDEIATAYKHLKKAVKTL